MEPKEQNHDVQEPNPVLENREVEVESASQSEKTQNSGNEPKTGVKMISFALLLLILEPQLAKDKMMQLRSLFAKLRKGEIRRVHFIRHIQNTIGVEMLRWAVAEMESKDAAQSRLASQQHQPSSPSQTPIANDVVGGSSPPFPGTNVNVGGSSSSPQPHILQMRPVHHNQRLDATPLGGATRAEYSEPKLGRQNSMSDPSRVPVGPIPCDTNTSAWEQDLVPVKVPANKVQSSTCFLSLNYYESFEQAFEQQCKSQLSNPQGAVAAPIESKSAIPGNLSGEPSFEVDFPSAAGMTPSITAGTDTNIQGGSKNSSSPSPPVTNVRMIAKMPSARKKKSLDARMAPKMPSARKKKSLDARMAPKMPSARKKKSLDARMAPKMPSAQKKKSPDARTAPKIPSVGEKKPVEGLGSSPPPPSKKQKVSGPVLEQRIEPLNDVCADSGVNLREGSKIPSSPSPPVTNVRMITEMPSAQKKKSLDARMAPKMPSVREEKSLEARTAPKIPSVGQKKPLEGLGSSPPPPSKKQKVSGPVLEQRIEPLNDVCADSGVNLREEEEQLLSGSKVDNRLSESSRRVLQKEERRILQTIPLQKKLAEIMAKCGLKNISNDVEQCLSLCLEERMRGLMSSLIRVSKQRIEAERPGNQIVLSLDVHQQIIIINGKAKEEWEKRQAGAKKLQNVKEVNKTEHYKLRMAANVAARAAVGGNDMLLKWQHIAEQSRLNCESGAEAAPGSHENVNHKSPSSGRNLEDNHGAGERSPAASGAARKFDSNPGIVPRVARSISIKDVLAALEKEPQMFKSTLIYRLLEKIGSNAC